MTSGEHSRGTGAWRPPSDPKPTARSVGKYEIKELIGAGAMGTVFRAHDHQLDRDVAVKVMRAPASADEQLHDRFLREARAAGSLQHPNIITVYDFGEANDSLFIAMEYVEGRDLSEIIRNHVRMPLVDKIDILLGVLDGLAYAHKRGITHRDIKPSNVRLTRDGHAKIMDFGVAHLAESELTHSGLVLGTPHYMAPEQVRGEDPAPTGDLFSVGAVLYELITHRKPFSGDTAHQILYNVASEAPVPLENLHHTVPEEVRKILKRSLEKYPNKRYQNAAQMAADLREARVAAMSYDETTIAVTPSNPMMTRLRPVNKTWRAAVYASLTLVWFTASTGHATRPTTAPRVALPPIVVADRPVTPNPTDSQFTPDTMVMSVRHAALAVRLAADSIGVPMSLLARGDSAARVADSLEQAGRFSQAVMALSTATTAWKEAQVVHLAKQNPPPSRPANSRRPLRAATESIPVAAPPADPKPVTTRDQIENVVNQLATALESRDIGRLRAAYPRLTAKERDTWERFFRSTRRLSMSLTVTELVSRGDSARALIEGSYSYWSGAGEQHRPMSFPAVFARQGATWQIIYLGRTDRSGQ